MIQKIIDLLEEARQKYNIPKSKLEKNGKIIYANGNDSTQFDWYCNNMLCEFGYGVEDGSVWAFKLLLDKNGNAEVYCYPHGESRAVDTITKKIMTKSEVYKLYLLMLEKADNKGLWDKTLDELGLV